MFFSWERTSKDWQHCKCQFSQSSVLCSTLGRRCRFLSLSQGCRFRGGPDSDRCHLFMRWMAKFEEQIAQPMNVENPTKKIPSSQQTLFISLLPENIRVCLFKRRKIKLTCTAFVVFHVCGFQCIDSIHCWEYLSPLYYQ